MAYFAPDPMETDVRLAPGGVHDSRPVAQNIGTQRSSIGIKSTTISKSGTAVRGQKTCLSAGAYGSHPYADTSHGSGSLPIQQSDFPDLPLKIEYLKNPFFITFLIEKWSTWACSAVGSASHSHCGGRRFESDQVH